MASAWSSAGLTIFALTVLARDSGAPSYSSPSTPVRARCFTLHSPHRAPTGAPYPGLPGPGYESHQSGTSGAGRPTRGGVFRPANGAASSPRPGARLYGSLVRFRLVLSPRIEMETLASILPYLNCLHRPKDAYHHVPIAAASRDLLGFTFNGSVYRFKALPFGLKPAPRLFTRLVGCGAAFLRQRGLQFFCYLDMLVANCYGSTWPSCYRQCRP